MNMNDKYKLDRTDLQILRTIQENAKMSYKDIAESLNISRTPVFERIKKMERNGIITQYITIVDEKKIRHSELIFCHIKMKEHDTNSIKSFEKLINSIPQVIECYHVTGECDSILKVRVRNMKEYQNLVLSQLSTENNILSFHSYFSMAKVKHQIHLTL